MAQSLACFDEPTKASRSWYITSPRVFFAYILFSTTCRAFESGLVAALMGDIKVSFFVPKQFLKYYLTCTTERASLARPFLAGRKLPNGTLLPLSVRNWEGQHSRLLAAV